jgi:hypothetical protein
LRAWMEQLTEEELSVVTFARRYIRAPHGVDGHHHLLLIAKLAVLLDGHEDMLVVLTGPGGSLPLEISDGRGPTPVQPPPAS